MTWNDSGRKLSNEIIIINFFGERHVSNQIQEMPGFYKHLSVILFSSCGSSPETEKIFAPTFVPAPISSFGGPAETPDAQSIVLSNTATGEYASAPLPESEYIKDGRKLVIDVVDAVENINIQYSPIDEGAGMLQKVLFGEDAQALYILLDALDCITVPNPFHC